MELLHHSTSVGRPNLLGSSSAPTLSKRHISRRVLTKAAVLLLIISLLGMATAAEEADNSISSTGSQAANSHHMQLNVTNNSASQSESTSPASSPNKHMSVTVNGQNVPVPDNGSVHHTFTSDNGTTNVEVNSSTSSDGSSSNTSVNSTTTDGSGSSSSTSIDSNTEVQFGQ
jgi:hypothetical protein